MLDKNAADQRALANLSHAIEAGLRFPRNVFAGKWIGFFFFDADWVFDAQFVERIKELLKLEGGQAARIADLDATPNTAQSSFLIETNTSGSSYQSFLNGPSVGEGWLHGVGRFGCTSNLGEWCIYCEKGNEIAVVAVRGGQAETRYKAVIDQLKALPIDQAIAKPLSYGFSERAMSAEWRAEIAKQYLSPIA